jgi:hypothetical protein
MSLSKDIKKIYSFQKKDFKNFLKILLIYVFHMFYLVRNFSLQSVLPNIQYLF